MKRVVIIGGGGHAREVADILRHQINEELLLIGCVVDDPENNHAAPPDLPLLGSWDWFDAADRADLFVICAVGAPQARKLLVERAVARGLPFTSAISPLACISPEAKLGAGVMIFPFSFISAGAFIGDHVIVNAGTTVSHQTTIASYGTLSPGVNIAGTVSIGEGCFVGIGARILQGLAIGRWSTIGAGSAVIRNVPDSVSVAGVPARIIETVAKDSK